MSSKRTVVLEINKQLSTTHFEPICIHEVQMFCVQFEAHSSVQQTNAISRISFQLEAMSKVGLKGRGKGAKDDGNETHKQPQKSPLPASDSSKAKNKTPVPSSAVEHSGPGTPRRKTKSNPRVKGAGKSSDSATGVRRFKSTDHNRQKPVGENKRPRQKKTSARRYRREVGTAEDLASIDQASVKHEKVHKDEDPNKAHPDKHSAVKLRRGTSKKQKSEPKKEHPCFKFICQVLGRRVRSCIQEYGNELRNEDLEGSAKAFTANEDKNRYDDIVCLDQTRVKLQGRPDGNDYIHANYVRLPGCRTYICTQGPLEWTCEEFWHMIIQASLTVSISEKVEMIVMLCDFCENSETKSAQYFPDVVGQLSTFGPITVKHVDQQTHSIEGLFTRHLSVEQNGTTLSITHMQMCNWPDHMAPMSTDGILAILNTIRSKAENRPVVVHCAAGIGRTGTFVGIDHLAEVMKQATSNKPPIAVAEFVKEMRKQRSGVVQNAIQYVFLHVAFMSLLIEDGVIEKPELYDDFSRQFKSYCSTVLARSRAKSKPKKVKAKEALKKKPSKGVLSAPNVTTAVEKLQLAPPSKPSETSPLQSPVPSNRGTK
ncbi:hypothetical protein M3Y95_01248200 [Aphelenchoides besseyi]|nr:hypothetical protein M3Y95_01248200 [Aphelenchoides besseyi]